jgi:hypothetical protein
MIPGKCASVSRLSPVPLRYESMNPCWREHMAANERLRGLSWIASETLYHTVRQLAKAQAALAVGGGGKHGGWRRAVDGGDAQASPRKSNIGLWEV